MGKLYHKSTKSKTFDLIKIKSPLIHHTNNERIKAAIEALPKGDIKKLKGYTSKYRLRVGTYRIIYDIQDNTLIIGAVLPRGDAYKKI